MNCVSEICVLAVQYRDRERYNMQYFIFRKKNGELVLKDSSFRKNEAAQEGAMQGLPTPGEIKNRPLLMLVCGYGVITKPVPDDSGIAEKVIREEEKFARSLWKEAERERLTFVRREQLAPLLQELEKRKIIPAGVFYIPDLLFPQENVSPPVNAKRSNADAERTDTDIERADRDASSLPDPERNTECATGYTDQLAGYAALFLKREITLKAILRPTAAGNALAALLYKKLLLPVLLSLLAVLAADTFIRNHLNEKLGQATARQTALQKKLGIRNESNRLKQELLKNMNVKTVWKYSHICSRIGACVPEKVGLTSLEIQPVRSKPGTGKPPVTEPDKILIAAQTHSIESVSVFLEKLQRESFGTSVQLRSLRQKDRAGQIVFSIEISL